MGFGKESGESSQRGDQLKDLPREMIRLTYHLLCIDFDFGENEVD